MNQSSASEPAESKVIDASNAKQSAESEQQLNQSSSSEPTESIDDLNAKQSAESEQQLNQSSPSEPSSLGAKPLESEQQLKRSSPSEPSSLSAKPLGRYDNLIQLINEENSDEKLGNTQKTDLQKIREISKEAAPTIEELNELQKSLSNKQLDKTLKEILKNAIKELQDDPSGGFRAATHIMLAIQENGKLAELETKITEIKEKLKAMQEKGNIAALEGEIAALKGALDKLTLAKKINDEDENLMAIQEKGKRAALDKLKSLKVLNPNGDKFVKDNEPFFPTFFEYAREGLGNKMSKEVVNCIKEFLQSQS